MSLAEFIQSYCAFNNLRSCLQGVYNLLVALAVVVAFFMFLFGIFENLLSTVPDVKLQGKNRMKNALIGLVIIFATGVILYWINPSIFSARLILYQITFQVPLVIGEHEFTYNINGVSYDITIPTLENAEEIDKLTKCQDPQKIYRVRMTNYYIPIIDEAPTVHHFLSNVTLQGTGFIPGENPKDPKQAKEINAFTAQNLLRAYKPPNNAVVKCKSGWKWSWVNYEAGEMKNCNPVSTKNSIQSESVRRELNITKDSAKQEIRQRGKSFFMHGSYGPLIPLRTVAHNINEGVFHRGDVVRVLECENKPNCRIKNTNLIVTDTGGGEKKDADAWLDLFAGVGEKALNTAQASKSGYVKVCIVGRINLNSLIIKK